MSWNEPEKGKGNDPWRGGKKSGGSRDSDGPPDLDELYRKFKRKIVGVSKNSGDSKDSPNLFSKLNLSFVLIAIVALWVLSGIYIVSPAERGVVTRFGKYAYTVDSGPHWFPRFIEKCYLVNVEQVDSFLYKAEMLTVDENIVSVQVSVQYRHADPRQFLFNVIDPVGSLQQATASALRQVVGNTTLDAILTTGRAEVRNQVAQQLMDILVGYQTGLEVVDVNLQPAKPPEAVTASFDDAIKAREDEQRYINQAQAYLSKVTSIAQGKVKRMLQEAEADRLQLIAVAKADTAGFLALLPQYKRAPAVTRQRLYTETMESILSNSTKVLVDVHNGNNMMYLPLDKILARNQTKLAESQHLNESQPSNPLKDSASTTEVRPGYSDDSQAGAYRWQQ